MRPVHVCLVILLAGLLSSSEDPADGWRSLHPGNGGQLQHLTCDPRIPGRMFMASDMEGFYTSDDYGGRWTWRAWELPDNCRQGTS